MGIKEGTSWDEHWVLYGNQFGNKFPIKKIKNRTTLWKKETMISILLYCTYLSEKWVKEQFHYYKGCKTIWK